MFWRFVSWLPCLVFIKWTNFFWMLVPNKICLNMTLLLCKYQSLINWFWCFVNHIIRKLFGFPFSPVCLFFWIINYFICLIINGHVLLILYFISFITFVLFVSSSDLLYCDYFVLICVPSSTSSVSLLAFVSKKKSVILQDLRHLKIMCCTLSNRI